MPNKFLTVSLFAAIGLALTSGQDAPSSVKAAPVVVGSPPGELARLKAELDTAQEQLAAALAAQVEDPLSPAVAPAPVIEPVAAPVKANCSSGQCRVVYVQQAAKAYAPQRRAILPWRRR